VQERLERGRDDQYADDEPDRDRDPFPAEGIEPDRLGGSRVRERE
jgi:hypothetical protein